MSTTAIRVENLSKMYRIGAKEQQPQTRAGAFKRAAISPIAYLRSMLRPPREEEIFWALRDVSFKVERGEVVGIIGRNGAGKSTLLKILSRITEPTSGRAIINGRVGSLLEIGTGFHPELTGRENIYLNGTMLGMKGHEITKNFDQIVDFSGVEKFINTPVKHYSSGMYVRLAFAVAAHLEPEILFVDEVLSVGDAEFQRKCLGKMGEVAEAGRTVLFVSHNMQAMQKLCERVLLLKDGREIFYGKTTDGIERYLSLATCQHNGYVDLSNLDRPLNITPIIQSIKLSTDSSNNQPVGTILTGDDVTLEITYSCGTSKLNYAVIGISTALDERICTMGTHLDPQFKGIITGKGRLRCHIKNLDLIEGRYTILVAMGTRIEGNLDYIPNALQFNVVLGNYFGTTGTVLPGQGSIAKKSEWMILSDAE